MPPSPIGLTVPRRRKGLELRDPTGHHSEDALYGAGYCLCCLADSSPAPSHMEFCTPLPFLQQQLLKQQLAKPRRSPSPHPLGLGFKRGSTAHPLEHEEQFI